MSELTPCPECQRHVRKSETRCPFCAEAISLSHLPAHALPRKRLGRAATFAFGASVVGATALVACGDDMTVAPPYGAAPPGGSSFAGGPVYGAPPSGSSSGGNSNAGAGGAGTAVYGAPAAGAGFDDTAGNGGMAGNGGESGDGGTSTDGGFGGGLIYGGPPSGAGGV